MKLKVKIPFIDLVTHERYPTGRVIALDDQRAKIAMEKGFADAYQKEKLETIDDEEVYDVKQN